MKVKLSDSVILGAIHKECSHFFLFFDMAAAVACLWCSCHCGDLASQKIYRGSPGHHKAHVKTFKSMPECIYNPITAMGFSSMFTFQLDNTKRYTLPAPHCRNGSCRYVRARWWKYGIVLVPGTFHGLFQRASSNSVVRWESHENLICTWIKSVYHPRSLLLDVHNCRS